MNVEIGAEAAQFPKKEYLNGLAVAVWLNYPLSIIKKHSGIQYNWGTINVIQLFLNHLYKIGF
jgi:hypothetical protein